MPSEFPYDVFLSHSVKDKAVVRPLAERMRHDGLMVWFDEWELPVTASRQSAAFSSGGQLPEKEEGGALPRRRYAEKIEEGLEYYRPTLQPSAFASCVRLRLGAVGGRRVWEGQLARSRPAESKKPHSVSLDWRIQTATL